MLPVVNRKKSRTRWRFHQKAGYRRKKKSLHASEQERSRCGAKARALLQRAGFPLYNLSVSLRSTAPLVGEPLAKPFTLRGLPRPLLQGATATTAASGGNREELLGPRPAGCERQRSRRWEPQPGQWHGVSRDGEVESSSGLRSGFPSYNLSVSLRSTAPLVGEPLAKRRSFPLCQSLPSVGEVARRQP